MDAALSWLEHPADFLWIKFEAEEYGFLDDVVTLRSDETLSVVQIKHVTERPDRPGLSLDDLLYKKTSRSRSLFENGFSPGCLSRVICNTNRLKPSFTQTGHRRRTLLQFSVLDFRRRLIPQSSAATTRLRSNHSVVRPARLPNASTRFWQLSRSASTARTSSQRNKR
jgi:hypothetical protein